ncbi:hypothetical protein FRC0431_01449 [Corynebacterium diphtheriae]|nr:hypothetical protein FRC0431_01449 [Corynebacterium diphtheriae]
MKWGGGGKKYKGPPTNIINFEIVIYNIEG